MRTTRQQPRNRTAAHARRRIAGLAVAVLPIVACSSSRPHTTEWNSSWGALRDTTAALIQPPHDLVTHTDPQTCDALTQIGFDARGQLLPAPTSTLDDRIALWADLVESLGSSCERNQNIATMTKDLAELGNHIDELIEESLPSR